ncbi:DUF5677 domain-containing protein [Arthrobacter sp. B2a2-09]|uniref:DUF5677 domain-containing protein n=1 Tax=Arthrobacter sp. B2a2-09 TaxID=2952822 RepID=UPI0022CD2FFE|nr:DUF5677 domain-containing protein [Arthrobacter sp. B2a2-09]MCZ9883904.1 hypothetical protein [Arthrobacter sp. B2a2-09]
MDAQRRKLFRRIFFDLKSIWLHGPQPTSLQIGEVNPEEFNTWSSIALAWGWTARVARSSEAAIRLSDDGFDEEAVPLLRSATEHAMWLWWISKDGGKVVETLQRKQAASLQTLMKAQEIGWTLDPPTLATIEEIIAQASERHKELDNFGRLSHLAKRYPEDLGNLYQGWLIETQVSHPTIQSSSGYFEAIPDSHPDGPGFRLTHRSSSQQNNTAAKSVIAFHVALTAFSAVAGLDDYYSPKLKRIDDRVGQL